MGGNEWGLVKGVGLGALSIWNPYAGAAAGAALGYLENQAKQRQMQRSLNARADAIKYSYGRKDGRGVIPDAYYYNNTPMADAFAGGIGGYMQGQAFQNAGMGGGGGETDWAALKGQVAANAPGHQSGYESLFDTYDPQNARFLGGKGGLYAR